MKSNIVIAFCAALLTLFGVVLIGRSLSDGQTVLAHTYTSPYSWYVMPQGEGVQPVVADNAPFIDDYDVVYLGDPEDKTIWLTFDVGYDNGNTALILDVLKEKNVQGAFFICGHVVDSCPELVKRMHDEGHLVCNHTNTHADLTGLSEEQIKKEIIDLEEKYYALTGDHMAKIVRPPEGNYSESTLEKLRDLGYKTMFWSFAYKDWINESQPSAEEGMRTIFSRAHPGMIALLHSTSATNAQILPDVIDALREKGYQFGTFDVFE